MKAKKTKKIRWLRLMLTIIALAVLIFSAANIIIYFLQSKEAKDNQINTFQTYVKTQETENAAAQNAPSDEQTASQGETIPVPDVEALHYEVDFAQMQAQNPDVCSWITIPALETVNFPVVWCGDNNQYLHHGWEGNYNWYGAIFMEGMNSPDYLDSHTIVYGHNMMDGSMFGTLEKFKDEEFYRENSPYVVVHTPDASILYEIFSVEYISASNGDVYRIAYTDYDDYSEFVNGMKERSAYDTGVAVTGDDRVITVSTCAYIFQGSRFVLHAKEIWRG